jgi:hypothetical protein
MMVFPAQPFSLLRKLPPALGSVYQYWKALILPQTHRAQREDGSAGIDAISRI